MFQEMMKKGPPRQKITVTYEGKAQEYVIPNSGEDEKMFRAEIRWFNKLDPRAQLNVSSRPISELENYYYINI